jgi:hypothetical protein
LAGLRRRSGRPITATAIAPRRDLAPRACHRNSRAPARAFPSWDGGDSRHTAYVSRRSLSAAGFWNGQVGHDLDGGRVLAPREGLQARVQRVIRQPCDRSERVFMHDRV